MNIIICGCGKIGKALLVQLIKENHNITIIDRDDSVLEKLTEKYDVRSVCGNGTMVDVQEEAGASEADLFIACTTQDEINMLAALLAKRNPRCKTIARIRDPQYMSQASYFQEHLKLDLIMAPEQLCAKEIFHLLEFPFALEAETFARGSIDMVKIKVPEKSILSGTSLIDLFKKIPTRVLIAGLEREDDFIIPDGNTVLEEGDVISLIARSKEIKAFCEQCNIPTTKNQSALVVGGGKCLYYLAKELYKANSKIDLKVIEKDENVAAKLEETLPGRLTVIVGDGSSETILEREGLEKVDTFLSLTNMDEVNVFLSYLASNLSKARIITKVNQLRMDLAPENYRVGSLVSSKKSVTNLVLRYVRGMAASEDSSKNFIALHQLAGGKGEALEFVVDNESDMTGKPLSELHFKKGVLVASIVRKSRPIHPSGQDVLKAGDHVIIFTTHHGCNELVDFIEK